MEPGLRYNEGKIRYDLLHPKALEGISKVMTKGAIKYAPRNWEKGMSWTSMIASLKRHLQAIEKGEDIDPETGELHIDHLQCNAHFLSAYYHIAPKYDDRQQWFKKPLKKVWLDIDGILAGFEEAYLKHFKLDQSHPNDWYDSRFVNLDVLKDDRTFWLSLPALIKPEDLTYPIAGYCTTRGCSNDITREWLNLHKFPAMPIINVGINNSKASVLNDKKCDVFIDDSIYNFMDCHEKGKFTTYLMSRPHNLKYDVQSYRVNNIKEFIQKLW